MAPSNVFWKSVWFALSLCLFNPRQYLVLAESTDSWYDTRYPDVTWNNDKWTLKTTGFYQGRYQNRMCTANGYFGFCVAGLGPFFEIDNPVNGDNVDGWPLFDRRQAFATIAGFFGDVRETNGSNFPWLNQYGGESVISGVPHPSGLFVDVGEGQFLDAAVDKSLVSNQATQFNLTSGVMEWKYSWTPSNFNGTSMDVIYTLFVHKLYVNQAVVQVQITPSKDCNVSIVDILDGRSALRTEFVESGTEGQHMYSAVKPNGIDNVVAWLYTTLVGSSEVDFSTSKLVRDQPYTGKNESTVARSVTAYLKAGQTTSVTKFIGVASSDAFQDARAQAKNASSLGRSMGYDESLQRHASEWGTVMPKQSVDDYTFPDNGTLPIDPGRHTVSLAINAVTNTFYLLTNTISENALALVGNLSISSWSISVGGLGSESYAGQVFWDAEIWMHTGLVVSHPFESTQIPRYRAKLYDQAIANVQAAYTSSKSRTEFSNSAAVYPWTSGRYGNCTAVGPCFDYEYHISGDIITSFVNQWVASGDTEFFRESLFPIQQSVATFYSEILTRNGSNWVLANMTDPDEYANNIDNGGFTMALIAQTLSEANNFREKFGMERNALWDSQAANVLIPQDASSGITKEYDNMNGSIAVKQADVILLAFPLDYRNNYTTEESLVDLDYYAGKQSLDGPGMTYAIFSIDASHLSPSGCSGYTYQLEAILPYVRPPWFQFSEQIIDDYSTNGGTHPAYPFLTGHGGAHQITIFAYLGLRLISDAMLHVDPMLPPQIPHLRYRRIYWHGWPIIAMANQTHTTLTRSGTPLEIANMTYANISIPVQQGQETSKTYNLLPAGTITLENRVIANISTIAGNIAQCVPVEYSDGYQPGQFALAAIDGAVSTKWKPNHANIPQSMTISLIDQPFQPITEFKFDWAQDPPATVTVYFHNISEVDSSAVRAMTVNVSVSRPYNAASVNMITPYMSNTTNVTLPSPIYSGKYATLVIQGNQGDLSSNATGATVAEWAIIGDQGQPLGSPISSSKATSCRFWQYRGQGLTSSWTLNLFLVLVMNYVL